MKPQDFSKQLKEYSTEMDAIKHQAIISKPTKAQDQIQRLLNTVFYTPFDVLQLRSSATQEDMKKQYRAFSFLLHPDKCKDPKAKDAFHVVQRSYKTILDPSKRDVDLRIMREARQRAVFQRKKQNERRIKNGQNPLEQSTFQEFYQQVIQKTFKQINNQRENIRKIQLSNHTKKMDDLETKKMVEQYKILTQQEWQRSRDKRVSNWRQFSKKKFVVGSKKSDGSIRPPPVKPQSRPDYTTVDDKKKNL